MALSHSRLRLRARIGAAHRYGAPAAEIAALHAEYGRLVRADVLRDALAASPAVTSDEADALIELVRQAAQR